MRPNNVLPFLLSLSTAASAAAIPTTPDHGAAGQLTHPNNGIAPADFPAPPEPLKQKVGGQTLPGLGSLSNLGALNGARGLPGADLVHAAGQQGTPLSGLPTHIGTGKESEDSGDDEEEQPSYGSESDDEDDDESDTESDSGDEDEDEDEDENDPFSSVSGAFGHGLPLPVPQGEDGHASHELPGGVDPTSIVSGLPNGQADGSAAQGYAAPNKRQAGLDSLTQGMDALPLPGADSEDTTNPLSSFGDSSKLPFNPTELSSINPLEASKDGYEKRTAQGLDALTGILDPSVLTSGLGNTAPLSDELEQVPKDAVDQLGSVVPGVGNGVGAGKKRAAQLPNLPVADMAGGLTHNLAGPLSGVGNLGEGATSGLPTDELAEVGNVVPAGLGNGVVKRAVGFSA